MKISKLIRLLQEKQTDHGDIEVTVWDKYDGGQSPVASVIYFHNGIVSERTVRLDVENKHVL